MNKFKLLITAFILLFTFSISVEAETISKPEISGETAITIDADSKDIIYAKNIDKRMYPASTTKLITSILLAENRDKNYIFTYTPNAKSQEQFSLDLPVGDKISADDAMKAILLFSANDIAYLAGEDIGGGNIESFANLMNKKVSDLNLQNTHFVTPNGLQNIDHYSSAYDMSVIAMQLYKYPWIMDTMLNSNATVKTSNGLSFTFDNRNKLIGKDGCIGGKTGFTSDAGRCLVTLYKRDTRNIIGVIMKCGTDINDDTIFNDMTNIINWSYSTEKSTLFSKNSSLKTINASYSIGSYEKEQKETNIQLMLHDDITKYDNGLNYDISYIINDIDPDKLDKNTSIGTVTLTEKSTSHTYNLYPDVSKDKFVEESKAFDKQFLTKWITIGASSFVGLTIIITIVILIKKKLKKHE